MLLHLYYGKNCFWTKAPRAFKHFGWILTFAKAKSKQTHLKSSPGEAFHSPSSSGYLKPAIHHGLRDWGQGTEH
jgi:hypothetical protein